MYNKERIELTTYTASPMEFISKDGEIPWRDVIKSKFSNISPNKLFIYNPPDMEAIKTKKSPEENNKYIHNAKRAGHFKQIFDNFNHIWWGNINPHEYIPIEILIELRKQKIVYGNYLTEVYEWGDWEAVVRSDFIIANLPKDAKTFGTIAEFTIASLFKIPIYWITDQCKTDASTTLLSFNNLSVAKNKYSNEVKIFQTIEECVDCIKKDYNL